MFFCEVGSGRRDKDSDESAFLQKLKVEVLKLWL